MTARRYANAEARRIFFGVLLKHLRRGNLYPLPEPIIAWRCATTARWICLGCPPGKQPRYLKHIVRS